MPIKPFSEKSWKENRKKLTAGRRVSWQEKGARESYKLSSRKFKLPKKKIIIFFLAAFFIVGIAGTAWVLWITKDLPDPNRLIDRQIAQSTKIYDRTGQTILYEINGGEKRTIINLSEIPDYVKEATIAVEDKDFYKHSGFSLWAIFRTALTDVLFNKTAGGSTLTQQFIKNAILTNEKTFTRKIKELVLAYRMEKRFSKDEILQMYFNEIPYGSTAYGVEAACQKYFGKSVRSVNLPEAAILAALPQAPSRYSPYGSHKDELITRQHYILDLMAKQGYITKEEALAAKNAALNFKEQSDNMTAPHFVMYIKDQLVDKYGEKTVEEGGLNIYTTLDLYKQKIAEQAVKDQVEKNQKKYNATNAALVSIDPKTGQILAMVGSKDYFDNSIDGQVNITTSLRQPGSSMKPVVYAAAFMKGYSPNTVLYDVVTNFSTDPTKPYEPHNYNGKEYGPVTIRKALAGSLNVPAVKTIYLAGIDNVLNLADNLGYTSFKDRSRFGLSLVLGGGEVELLEHANAYSAFAREGEIHPTTGILKIVDKDGKVLEEYKDQTKTVFDANIAREINDVLTDNASRAFIFGEKNFLTLPNRPVAVKTGTTNDNHDAWTIGYTPSLVTGVWVGNNDNQAMKVGADGSVVAAPIWNNYMKQVLGNTPAEQFNKPDIPLTGKPVLDGNTQGGITVKIDRASNLLATENTPASFVEEVTFAQPHDILYYINKDDPLGPAPKNPADDPQFTLWETRVQAWAASNSISSSSPPAAYDNLHVPENKPSLSITSPSDKISVTNPVLSVAIQAAAPRGVSRAEYYIDSNLVWSNSYYPFNLNKDVSFLKNGFHALSVRVCDDIDNCSDKGLDFNLMLNNNARAGGDIILSWQTLKDNSTFASSSFPVSLDVYTSNLEQTAKISFYYYNVNGGTAQLISSISPIVGNRNIAPWKSPPPPGAYRVYAEATGWNGQSAKSPEINISIN